MSERQPEPVVNLLAGVLFVSIALLLLWVLIPQGVDAPRKVKFAALHPAYYPNLVAYALLLIGSATVVVAARGIFARTSRRQAQVAQEETTRSTARGGWLTALYLVVLFTGIVSSLPYLGFPLVTGLALFFILPLGGEGRWWLVTVVALSLPMLLYLFFVKVANIPIPGGVLDPWLLAI